MSDTTCASWPSVPAWPAAGLIGRQFVAVAGHTRDRASLSQTGLASYILGVHRRHPELRSARAFALGGLAYFVVLCGAWIAYAAHLGI